MSRTSRNWHVSCLVHTLLLLLHLSARLRRTNTWISISGPEKSSTTYIANCIAAVDQTGLYIWGEMQIGIDEILILAACSKHILAEPPESGGSI